MYAITKIVVLILFTVYACSSNPQLEIKQGILQGKYLQTIKGRIFSAFTAIPYAQPPVGDLRFKVSLPAGPWKGILDASKPHSICPQNDIFFTKRIIGDEDCLYLNVYTPQLKFPSKRFLPVMIFIHPGAFVLGNGNQDICHPSSLLDKDIVLVVLQYRLGPLGFLSTGDTVVPGNNGLKDQNLAIRWTKDNIYHFGGNPERLIIFGQSAGGASAHFHMLSPLSKGLINGVISQSGTAFSPWAFSPNDQNLRNSRTLAESFNCSTKSSLEMINCLRKVDAYAIIKQQQIFEIWNGDPMTPFKPVVEPNLKGAFLPEHPIDIIKSDKAAKVPFITGITSEDGAMKSPGIFGNPQMLDEFGKYFDKIAPISLLYYETAPDADYVTKQIKEFYFDNNKIDNSSHGEVTDMYTDDMFFASANNVVQLHANYTKESIYYYVFSYRGSVSHSEIFGDPYHDYGVAHADELCYLFYPNLTFPNYVPNAIELNMTEVLTTLWTNFATTGNPTPSKDSILSTIWEPIKNGNLEYYYIKNVTNITMVANLYHERAEFWKYLPVQ